MPTTDKPNCLTEDDQAEAMHVRTSEDREAKKDAF
jgi:hypothetical protein